MRNHRLRGIIGVLACSGALLLCATAPVAAAPGWRFSAVPVVHGGPFADLTTTSIACPSATSCKMFGTSLDKMYNSHVWVESLAGSAWSGQNLALAPGSAIQDAIYAVECTSTVVCIGVGAYTSSTYRAHPLVEMLASGHWIAKFPPAPAGTTAATLYGVSCMNATHCVAAGSATKPNSHFVAFVDVLTGTAWSIKTVALPAGALDTSFDAVTCSVMASCHAAGSWTAASNHVEHPLVATLMGSAWVLSKPPATNSLDEPLSSISCTSPTMCHAVGSWTRFSPSYTIGSFEESLNGSAWHATNLTVPGGWKFPMASSVACPTATTCLIVGAATSTSTVSTSPAVWEVVKSSVKPSVASGPATLSESGFVATACYSAGVCRAAGAAYSTSASSWTAISGVGPS